MTLFCNLFSLSNDPRSIYDDTLLLNNAATLDRWRPQMTCCSRSLFGTCWNRLNWDNTWTTTGDPSTICVDRVTSTTISSVITRHFIKTLNTFCDWYLIAAFYLPTTLQIPFSFPPPISTVETETRANFCENSMTNFRRISCFVWCRCTRKTTKFSATNFRT